MNANKKQLCRYYREINGALFCTSKTRKQIMDGLKSGVSTYLNGNPGSTMDDVYATFGSPQQIAASYVEELSTPELIQKIKLRKRLIRSVIAVVSAAAIICVALWIATVVTALISVHNSSNPYVEIYIEEE